MDNHTDQNLGIVAILTTVFCIGVILVSAGPAVTFNPTKPLVTQEFHPIQLVLPQGFAFFTRDAREPDLYLFQQRDGAWQSASLGPNSRPSNLFGLNRKSRAQSVESALIVSKLLPTAWSECRDNPTKCLGQSSVQDTIRNVVPAPTLCGPVGFVLQEPVPWAWSKSQGTTDMHSQITNIHIQC